MGGGFLCWLAAVALVAMSCAAVQGPGVEEPSVSSPNSITNGPIWFQIRDKGEGPGQGVWEVLPDGGGLRKVLDFNEANYWQIAWSPKGDRIAFVNSLVDGYGLYTSDPDGIAAQRLTAGVHDGWPSWSPDGSKIAFSSAGSGEKTCEPGADGFCPTDIYVMDVDGTHKIRLTDDPAPEYQPAWSPDGTRIAFARAVDAKNGTYAIFVMNATGTAPRLLTLNAGSSPHPAWSIGGERIAFAGHEGPTMYIIEADGSNEHLLVPETGSTLEGPHWSPDGTKIAFTSDRGGVSSPVQCGTDALCPSQVYVVSPDGTGLERLTAVQLGVGGIAWRPIPANEPTESFFQEGP